MSFTPDPHGSGMVMGDARAGLFGRVMGLLGATMGFTALGAYVGRHMVGGAGILFFLCGFACIFALNVASSRGDERLAVGLLFALGLLLGLAVAPLLDYYANANPTVVYQAASTTALWTAILGLFGYSTHRNLSAVRRYGLWALLALILFGLVATFAAIPGSNIIYCVAGMVLFSAFTAADFQRLSRSRNYASAAPLAAALFLDIFNIFLMLLDLLNGASTRR